MFMRQLTYLIALDKHRHFGRAADSCHVSQPALSNALPPVITIGVVGIAAKAFRLREDSHVSAGESARQMPDLVR